jgi:hypothetical protein
LTSSALTTPNPWTQRTVNRLAVRWPNLFEPDYQFRGGLLTCANNFGMLAVQPLPEGGHRVTCAIREWQPRKRKLVTAGRVVTQPDSG